MAKLQAQEPQRTVDIQIAADLRCRADPKLVRMLLHQLFDNAWKFTREVPGARIEFGGTCRDSQLECFVRDNGVGFDMAFAERIFAAFQRLPHTENYSGTGIGLAIAQRIVRKHGGHLRAEGSPGLGAAFYFALPVLNPLELP